MRKKYSFRADITTIKFIFEKKPKNAGHSRKGAGKADRCGISRPNAGSMTVMRLSRRFNEDDVKLDAHTVYLGSMTAFTSAV